MVFKQRNPSCLVTWSLCVILCAIVAKADYGRTCYPEDIYKKTPSGICGSELSNLLNMLCKTFGGFHGIQGRDRRSADLANPNPKLKDLIVGNGPFLDRFEALTLMSKRAVGPHQGIVCECCFHQCAVSELTSYCANGDHAIEVKRAFVSLDDDADARNADRLSNRNILSLLQDGGADMGGKLNAIAAAAIPAAASADNKRASSLVDLQSATLSDRLRHIRKSVLQEWLESIRPKGNPTS